MQHLFAYNAIQWVYMQETLEEGCRNIDADVASFADVGIKDRSMVWNTDLIEVRLRVCFILCHVA